MTSQLRTSNSKRSSTNLSQLFKVLKITDVSTLFDNLSFGALSSQSDSIFSFSKIFNFFALKPVYILLVHKWHGSRITYRKAWLLTFLKCNILDGNFANKNSDRVVYPPLWGIMVLHSKAYRTNFWVSLDAAFAQTNLFNRHAMEGLRQQVTLYSYATQCCKNSGSSILNCSHYHENMQLRWEVALDALLSWNLRSNRSN